MRSLLWFLLAIGLVALVFIYLEQNGITVASLSALDTSSLAVKIVIVALLGVVVLALFRERFSQALKSILIWIAIALALAVGYTYRFELRDVADRVMAEFVPGHAATARPHRRDRARPGRQFRGDDAGQRRARADDLRHRRKLGRADPGGGQGGGAAARGAVLFGRRSRPPTGAPAPRR